MLFESKLAHLPHTKRSLPAFLPADARPPGIILQSASRPCLSSVLYKVDLTLLCPHSWALIRRETRLLLLDLQTTRLLEGLCLYGAKGPPRSRL